jgi:hypothetical protein
MARKSGVTPISNALSIPTAYAAIYVYGFSLYALAASQSNDCTTAFHVTWFVHRISSRLNIHSLNAVGMFSDIMELTRFVATPLPCAQRGVGSAAH